MLVALPGPVSIDTSLRQHLTPPSSTRHQSVRSISRVIPQFPGERGSGPSLDSSPALRNSDSLTGYWTQGSNRLGLQCRHRSSCLVIVLAFTILESTRNDDPFPEVVFYFSVVMMNVSDALVFTQRSRVRYPTFPLNGRRQSPNAPHLGTLLNLIPNISDAPALLVYPHVRDCSFRLSRRLTETGG